MFNKFKTIAAASMILGVLAGCNGSGGPTLKVWGPPQDRAWLIDVARAFKNTYPQYDDIRIEIGLVAEPDLRASLLRDVGAGGDVFTFPDDQLKDLVDAGAIMEVSPAFATDVATRNIDWTVTAATLDDKLYAYPFTSDNSIFMFYDKAAISASEMGTLDSIIAKATSLNKNILLDPMGGWASATWFTESGNVSYDGVTQVCDWNDDAGLNAAQGMFKAYESRRFVRDESAIVTAFDNRTIIAGVSGTWNIQLLQEVLGDDYGFIKLPTFTTGEGTQQQMGTFIGSKLVGVNALTQYPGMSHDFANYLTNEANQVSRALAIGNGPSNVAASSNPSLETNETLQVIQEQQEFGIPQSTSVGPQYWTPAGSFADWVITNATNTNAGERAAAYNQIQFYLDLMVDGILAFNP
jgi:arabinogalactan oligomer / maltooligosaccharide transport system substrate-binding protein